MNDAAQIKKKRAYLWGQGAEWLCMCFLIFKGYRILARRYRCKSGEIGLVARKGSVLCFIEVKARQTKQAALEAVSFRQKSRISRAAEWYKARNGHDTGDISCRFDVMAVEPWAWPTHVKDAWQTDVRK